MMSLVLKLLRPQGQRSELILFLLALVIAVASVASVSLMADRLNQALQISSRDFIAADKVLRSSDVIEPTWLKKADELGLRYSTTMNFNSMLFTGEQFQLASLRAVDSQYPLRGQLLLSDNAQAEKGRIWLSAQLSHLLKVKVGELIEVGNGELEYAGLLIKEPDAGFSPFSLAPSALIHIDDLASLEVVLQGSKVSWRYLFSGDVQDLEKFATWLEPELQGSQKFYGVEQSNASVAMPLQRAERFYMLAALVGVLLGALAMGITLRHYAQSQLDSVALLKTLGASSKQVMTIYWALLGFILFLGIVGGLLLGFAIQSLLIYSLADLIPKDLPAPSLKPLFLIVVMALTLTFVSAYSPLSKLLKTPPLRVLRLDMSDQKRNWLGLGLILVGPIGLVWLVSGDLLLSGALLLGLVVLMLGVAVLAWALLLLSKPFFPKGAIHLALQRLRRHRWQSMVQLSGLATALLLMAIVLNLSGDLSYIWQQRSPDKAPNRFMVNIPPQDIQLLDQSLKAENIVASDMAPMIRARMVAINGLSLKQWFEGLVPERIDRERNLTWLDELPKGNQVVEGRWWQNDTETGISLEQGYAQRLKVSVGDELTFYLDGLEVKAPVTNIRTVDWQTMQPNFFIVFSPKILKSFAATYIASFYLPEEKLALESQLVRQFPTSSIINVGNIMAQIDSVITKVSKALSLMVLIVIAAAVLVMLALLQVSMRERQQELVLMRTLGAQASLLRNAMRWELLITGGIAGVVAVVSVEAVGYLLNTLWLEVSWRPHLMTWLMLPSLGALLSISSGSMQIRPIVNNVLAKRIKVF